MQMLQIWVLVFNFSDYNFKKKSIVLIPNFGYNSDTDTDTDIFVVILVENIVI